MQLRKDSQARGECRAGPIEETALDSNADRHGNPRTSKGIQTVEGPESFLVAATDSCEQKKIQGQTQG